MDRPTYVSDIVSDVQISFFSLFQLETFDHNTGYSCQLSTSHIHTGCYQPTDLVIKAHQMESLSTT